VAGLSAGFVWTTAVRDARWRWKRFLTGGLAAALVLGLTVLLTGFVAQIDNEISRTIDAIGGSGFVVAAGTPGPFTSVSPIPVTIGDELDASGTPAGPLIIVLQTIARDDGPLDVYVIGYAPGRRGEPAIAAGRLPAVAGEVVVDESAGRPVGSHVDMRGITYSVVGTTKDLTVLAGRPEVFMLLPDAQRAFLGGQPLAMAFAVDQPVSSPPAGTKFIDLAAGKRDLRRPLGKMVESISVFRVLLWLVAAAIVGSVLYLSALERAREMAVHKATGAASRDLVAGLVVQAVCLALASGVGAILLALVLAPIFPVGIRFSTGLLISAPVVAVVVGIVGSVAGLRRVLHVDPALAFGGP
jgi:putative ABC transport system permease protein